MWHRGRLEVHSLRNDQSGYDQIAISRLLPGLPIAAIEAAVIEEDVVRARRRFTAAIRSSQR